MTISRTFLKKLSTAAVSFSFFTFPFTGSVTLSPPTGGSLPVNFPTSTIPIAGQVSVWSPNRPVYATTTTAAYYYQQPQQQALSKNNCKKGGYAMFGFSNQGQCVSTAVNGGSQPVQQYQYQQAYVPVAQQYNAGNYGNYNYFAPQQTYSPYSMFGNSYNSYGMNSYNSNPFGSNPASSYGNSYYGYPNVQTSQMNYFGNSNAMYSNPMSNPIVFNAQIWGAVPNQNQQ